MPRIGCVTAHAETEPSLLKLSPFCPSGLPGETAIRIETKR
jgi:hypothetical protein